MSDRKAKILALATVITFATIAFVLLILAAWAVSKWGIG